MLFADLRRLLVPGGRAAVTFPERSGFATFPPAQTEGFFLHELADLSRAMTEVGFEDVTVHDGPGPRPPGARVGSASLEETPVVLSWSAVDSAHEQLGKDPGSLLGPNLPREPPWL